MTLLYRRVKGRAKAGKILFSNRPSLATLLPMTRDQFIRLCFLALLIFIVYQVFLIFRPFVETIFWASILTFAFYPVYDRIKKKMGSDTPAALLTTLIIFLIVIIPVAYLIVSLTSQAIELYQFTSDYVRQGHLADLIERIRHLQFVEHLKTQSSDVWNLLKENSAALALRTSKTVGNFAALQLASITKNLFFILINIFLMIVLIFIFLKDGLKIYDFIYQTAPLDEKNKKPIFKLITETFSAVIRGQLLTAISQAIIGGVTFWLLGIPIPILFAAAIFFASMIPVFGAATVWVPLCGYLFVSHQTVKAIILFFVGALIISLLDNLIKPGVIGEKTKLPYFLLLFGILGGIKIYGLMGIFLAPVVLALFFSLIRIYQEKNW